MNKKNIILSLILCLIFFILLYIFFYKLINLKRVQDHLLSLTVFVSSHYLLSVMLYIIIYYASVILVFPVAAVINIAGGYLFGTIMGTVYTCIGSTIAAVNIMVVARYLLKEYFSTRLAHRMLYIKKIVKEYTIEFLLFIRLAMIFPFFLINIFLGLSSVPLWTLTWTTTLGTLPAFLIYAYAGRQLVTLHSISSIFRPSIILALILISLLPLIPVVIKKHFLNRKIT